MRAAAIRNSEVIATLVLSATAGAVAVARTIFNERLSDDLLKSTREGTKARLGLSDAAPSGGTVQ
jgi:hypothetical protein